MRRALALAAAMTAALLVAGCQTLAARGSLASGVSLSVVEFNADSGEYTLALRNDSPYEVRFLDPFVHLSRTTDRRYESPEEIPWDLGITAHDRLLAPGQTRELSGTCTKQGLCERPGVHAGIDACWETASKSCQSYELIWSDRPINGATVPGEGSTPTDPARP